MQNPQAIELPGAWIAQVISIGVKCIMWNQWKAKYSGIAKRIVLFTDMTLNVSNRIAQLIKLQRKLLFIK